MGACTSPRRAGSLEISPRPGCLSIPRSNALLGHYPLFLHTVRPCRLGAREISLREHRFKAYLRLEHVFQRDRFGVRMEVTRQGYQWQSLRFFLVVVEVGVVALESDTLG